jgi:hypothetical protein
LQGKVKNSYIWAKKGKMRLTEEEFMAIAKSFYEEMTTELKDEEIDFYEYESRLDKKVTDFGRTILEKSLSDTEVSSEKKKKNTDTIRKNRFK